MIRIISAFGGQRIQDDLYKDMKNQDMIFLTKDCDSGIVLMMEVEQHPDVDVVVVGHMAVKDIDSYLAQIREITKTARIVLLLNGTRKQYLRTLCDEYKLRVKAKGGYNMAA